MSVSKNSQTTLRKKAPSPTERKLVDELHTHQVELEMQNHELVRAKTDLEHSRARYFELFDFAPVPYFTFKSSGIIESLNLAAAELLQHDRDRSVGVALSSFLEDGSRAAFNAHLETVFQTPGRHTLDLVIAPGPQSTRRHVHVVSRIIRGELGDVPLCLSAVVDITARKSVEEEATRLNAALEQRVMQRTRELEDTNKDLEAFIYSISHDLRAPLRNMAGFSTIIVEDFATRVPEEVLGYVRRIQAGNEKMLRLVDDLLRFSRLGRKPLDLTPTDLNQLLEEALGDLSNEMENRDVQWRRKPLPVAECDRGLMRQVFVNFISNALKYSRPRKPAIISVGTEVRDGLRMIYIQDNGVGFDMKYKEKLFGVFQRLHGASEFEGNGVGLAMIARILHRHGGQAVAEGAVDRGATFRFTFPGLRDGCTVSG
ncbi:MAG TPA: ATP-binding protein [Opitutaceae bacterium]|nr:ATP-binding protein [Opitutaceae bacterium]